jgi:hypothetical protein
VGAADGEELVAARAVVRCYLGQLSAHHVAAEGKLLLHAADHGAAGRMVAACASGPLNLLPCGAGAAGVAAW